MISSPEIATDRTAPVSSRVAALFNEQWQNIIKHTDHLFSWLMVFQWFFAVALAVWLSPRTWAGMNSRIHPHVWFAIFLGGIITSLPVYMARKFPGEALTRHTIAVGQMLMSGLLIHLTGGRIETHFHVFGSLAILAFYRDWTVLLSATVVVCADHLARGFLWPQSVYGVLHASIWRSFEHAGWVLFEVVFLIISIQKSLSEMLLVAERQAQLEELNGTIEQAVADRTAELTRENEERCKSEAQLAQAQQIARLGSWEWDVINNRVIWSQETRRMYGRRPEDAELSIETCLERVHPDDLPGVKEIMTESLRTGRSFTCDHRIILPDGSLRIISARGEVVLSQFGEPIKMIGTMQDVTDLKQAEQALRCSEDRLLQSQKMEAVGRLAGGVAHDFNNILTVIGGYCSMALQTLDKSNPLQKNFTEIQNASERAASLTRQLLAFSRKQVLQPRVLQLNEVVQNMEKMLRRLIGEDIELSTVFGVMLGRIKADPGQLEQVIMNLAVNARDAMPRGGKLTISTANVVIDQELKFRNRTLDVGQYVLLAITDNGVGMTEEVKAHLFEPFFTTKGLGKGTGLGLATCYGIISQSGGDIHVYSEPNCGTTFKIYLPRTDSSLEPAMVADTSDMPGGNESILIVEDDPAVRRLAVVILRNCGYKIQESNNAFEALELIRRKPNWDLVLSDVIMPQMSGKELSDKIRRQCPQTKILLMSGYTDDALAHHGVLDEGLLFLEKPFSPARLARKVREILDTPGSAVENLHINGSSLVPV
ncbi:MAG TPA: ATP-binding protein [Verrucomicrobiae bacterium]